jgi:thiol-disulfide isomerase/thioredoxin
MSSLSVSLLLSLQVSFIAALPLPVEPRWIPVEERKPADLSLQLRTLDGKKVSLETFVKGVVLVNVWATWCVPCKEEMPSLGALYDSLHKEGLEIVLITNEDAKKVQRYLKDKHFPYVTLLDPGEKLVNRFLVDRVPTTLVIDNSGKVALRHTGVVDWNSPAIIEALRSLMSQGIHE